MANIQDLWCGKMSPEHSHQTKVRTSRQSLRQSAKLSQKPLMYLSLKNGATQGASWQMISLLRGESLMLSIGEYPKEERESTLSQILQMNVPEKYYLSPRACLGILKRASARGKELQQS